MRSKQQVVRMLLLAERHLFFSSIILSEMNVLWCATLCIHPVCVRADIVPQLVEGRLTY